MLDDKVVITEEESKKIEANMFSSLSPLKLKVFSSKEKKKIVILRRIIKEFSVDKAYTEMEVNGVLKEIYEDFATLRRALIDYGYMERSKDCKEYRVREK